MKWRKNTKSRLWNIGLSLLMFGLVVGCTAKEAPNSPDESNRTSNESNTSKEVPNENITEEQAPVSSKGSKEDFAAKKYDHIVIVMEENHSASQIIGNAKDAPYINSLAKEGANLTNMYAITHPSQPNYIAFFSGGTQGVKNNDHITNKFTADNLGGLLIKNGYSYTGYSESLPSVGSDVEIAGTYDSGNYKSKHNPSRAFADIPKESNRPFTDFPSDFSQLPTISFVVPNQQNDMHDGSIKKGDDWVKANMDGYIQWAKTNNSLFILTFDEDNGSKDNKIPTIIVGEGIKPGDYSSRYTLYSLLKFVEDIYGLAYAGESKNAADIRGIWE